MIWKIYGLPETPCQVKGLSVMTRLLAERGEAFVRLNEYLLACFLLLLAILEELSSSIFHLSFGIGH